MMMMVTAVQVPLLLLVVMVGPSVGVAGQTKQNRLGAARSMQTTSTAPVTLPWEIGTRLLGFLRLNGSTLRKLRPE